MSAWIGVDLDGTLAKYTEWKGLTFIGDPIWPMVERVRRWLDAGWTVKIMTARVANGYDSAGKSADDFVPVLHSWLKEVGLPPLEVTCQKDFHMVELWDDRAIHMRENTGQPVGGQRSRVEGLI